MSRFTIPVYVLALAVSPAIAQQLPNRPVTFISPNLAELPPRLPLIDPARTAPPAALGNSISFSPETIELRLNNKHWQLWSGQTMIKDFADSRESAYEARRLIADMKLTERTVIGTPEPVMEYWLAGGQAPAAPSFARNVIPFDARSLKIDKMNDNFCVRDAHQVLYNFGPYVADAQLALAVLQKYQFNELGLVGNPKPAMTYLIRNEHSRGPMTSMESQSNAKILAQQAQRHPLVLPKLGTVGEFTMIDPMRTEIQKGTDGWHLVCGPHDLAQLGPSDYAAREALRAIQRYPLDEYVRVGTAGFGFYLSRTRAPIGAPIGARRTPIDPLALAVKPAGEQIDLTDGRHVLASFGKTQVDEAKLALSVVRYYGFDSQCEVGGFKFLVKDR